MLSIGLAYTSEWVDTHSKFYYTSGHYEFRAQMPGMGTIVEERRVGEGTQPIFINRVFFREGWPAICLLSEQLCWP